jgi:glycosyltransferase involved in cell wall biosynthesis
MRFLFLHNDFPGQYAHAARYLAREGHDVVAIARESAAGLEGVRQLVYASPDLSTRGVRHEEEFVAASRNAVAVARACERLKARRFTPDLVLGHGGWGETLLVKEVWPQTPVLTYFEFFYRTRGSDADFDPEFPLAVETLETLPLRNAVNLLALDAADEGQTPTSWQQAQFPDNARPRIHVAHEGVDTELVRPNGSARVWLGGGVNLGAEDLVVTYCARNLEPYRGFHIFMRALPRILARSPRARVAVVGGDGVSYGSPPKGFGTWREAMIGELGDALDLSRVYFLGRLPFAQYLAILRISSVHVYMTYPFILSWSLIEALATGCMVVASRTAPVEEAIEDGRNGWLVDFFDASALADRVVEALERRSLLGILRTAARASAIERYDLHGVCLPRHRAIWESAIGRPLSIRRRRPSGEVLGAAPAGERLRERFRP